ncbi:MAG: hypothetical protein K2Y37_15945 [Pirellulales bacterium]|nr:hypothetical protein [Pirellulales bacterium]
MIEIFVMIGFVKKIAARAREKGQSAGLFGFLLVAFWVVGEFAGAAFGAGVSAAGGGEPQMPLVYGLALVGAALGAMSAFGLLGLTPDHGTTSRSQPQTFELAADSTVGAR